MWPKKPSRVPGRRQTSRTWRATSRAETAGAGLQVPRGPLRTTANVTAAASMLAAAAARPPRGARARGARRTERDRPAGGVQQGDEGHGRENLTELTEDAGELG